MEPLSSLGQRYPQPDLRAALAQHLQSLMQAPAANVGAPDAPQGPQMPNLSTMDFGRFRKTTADYNAGPIGASGAYQTFDGKPAGWQAMLKYNSDF